MQKIMKVEGMMCEHCENRVESALKAEGISGKADAKNGTVTIEDSSYEEKAKEIIEDAGYDVVG